MNCIAVSICLLPAYSSSLFQSNIWPRPYSYLQLLQGGGRKVMGGSTVVHEHHMWKVLLCLIPSWWGWGWRGGGGGCRGRRRFHHLACLQEANQIGICARILNEDDHMGNAHHQCQQLQWLHFHQVLCRTVMMVKERIFVLECHNVLAIITKILLHKASSHWCSQVQRPTFPSQFTCPLSSSPSWILLNERVERVWLTCSLK